MMVSAPQRVAHTILSTSSAIELVTAELPNVGIDFTANALPMIIGSLSGWLWLAGITARPGHLIAHQLGEHTFAGGDERHLRGDLAGPRPLQLGAFVADHTGPRREPGMQIDHCVRIRVRTRRVVQVQVLAVGQVHTPKRHPVAVDLGAARDRAGGHRRID